jgi:putative Holliday junction resolvase
MRELYGVGRIVGLDVGERRIGVAVSDPTATLARPVGVLQVRGLGRAALDAVAGEVARLDAEEDGVEAVVVGLPRRLDGTSTPLTLRVEAFAAGLRRRTRRTVILQDERLTSREAESRLALFEKRWRARKARLDAAAAALILQDYLDATPRGLVPAGDPGNL